MLVVDRCHGGGPGAERIPVEVQRSRASGTVSQGSIAMVDAFDAVLMRVPLRR
jgi:hypothetical protein